MIYNKKGIGNKPWRHNQQQSWNLKVRWYNQRDIGWLSRPTSRNFMDFHGFSWIFMDFWHCLRIPLHAEWFSPPRTPVDPGGAIPIHSGMWSIGRTSTEHEGFLWPILTILCKKCVKPPTSNKIGAPKNHTLCHYTWYTRTHNISYAAGIPTKIILQKGNIHCEWCSSFKEEQTSRVDIQNMFDTSCWAALLTFAMFAIWAISTCAVDRPDLQRSWECMATGDLLIVLFQILDFSLPPWIP